MKKFNLFVLVTLVLIGCDPEVTDDSKVKQEGVIEVGTDNKGVFANIRVFEFEWKRHKYVQFDAGQYRSITHDPDCLLKDLMKTKTITIDTVIVNPVLVEPRDTTEEIGW